jgi:hypothetical protein
MSETKSVLPADTAGTEITRFNALAHRILPISPSVCPPPSEQRRPIPMRTWLTRRRMSR